ncbi:hypothetical protein MBLNU457_4012t1 [Dothideomycetes sp. NU457]
MSRNINNVARDIGGLDLDDSDQENLVDSPETRPKPSGTKTANGSAADPTPSRTRPSRFKDEEAREIALRKELESVRNVNKVIENVIQSLEKSRNNMNTVHRSVQSASTLLNTWTRILSQTEHNQRLILNPNWHGATQDLEDMENESILRQQAAERRAVEEQMRREAAMRQAEEEERKRAVSTPSSRGTRGRVRTTGVTRGASSSSANTSGIGRGRATARAGSSIGRGATSTRGRPRGTT